MTGTKLTLQINDTLTTWETIDDCPTAGELLDAFVGLLVGQTFSIKSAENVMKDYLWEHGILKGNEDRSDE